MAGASLAPIMTNEVEDGQRIPENSPVADLQTYRAMAWSVVMTQAVTHHFDKYTIRFP